MRRRTTTLLTIPAALAAARVGLAGRADDKPITPVTPNAAGKNFTETIPGTTVKFDMVYVPGGEFTMGSPDGEPGRDANEGPAHRVKVGGMWVGKCEVTWDEFDLFWKDKKYPVADEVGAKGLGADAVTRPTNTFVDETYEHGREGFPVICMTHHAAFMYCNWLAGKTGRAFRLPTEAEWEYAARGGTTTAYSFGDDPERLDENGWFKKNSPDDDHPKGTTHKVGTHKPNPFGLHDMHGNVWEWTLDQYDPEGYAKAAKENLSLRPVEVPTAEKWSHVVRGGSWADKADRCRSAARRVSEESWQKHDPQEPRSIWWLTRQDTIGFRLALAENELPALVGLKPKVVKKSE